MTICIIMPQMQRWMGFSARAYDKVLRAARMLADLEGADATSDKHISEAVQYRSLDRQFFG